MSLWLQSTIESLQEGDYEHVRTRLLPTLQSPIPGCALREIEFGERHCRDKQQGSLFPIRFLWWLEGLEQQNFGLTALGRSRYHPEKLLEVWERICRDQQYRQELEAQGFKFDLTEKAVELTAGWVYIGERFVEDFLEVETALGVELLFPGPQPGDKLPAFQAVKQKHRGL
jgi:hypothetical protein